MASSSQPPSSASKRQKLSLQEEAAVENDGIDRISDLPDCLLLHILSFLPTKKAVKTSILSSRWKTLWVFVPCLYLDNYLNVRLSSSLHEQWNHRISFSDIVSRVFAQHKAPYLWKFHLNIPDCYCDAFNVDTWVRASISPNLKELNLSIYNECDPSEYNCSVQMFELPRSIFSCKSLVVLRLCGKILLNIPSSFKLPSLKILHLWLTSYNVDPYWKLLSGCPVLEDLILEIDGGEDYHEVVKLEICLSTLKRLKFAFIIVELEHSDYELEINAPALIKFLL